MLGAVPELWVRCCRIATGLRSWEVMLTSCRSWGRGKRVKVLRQVGWIISEDADSSSERHREQIKLA